MWAALGWVWRKPMRTLGVLALSGVMAAVLVNALVLQAKRHPSPLFSDEPAARTKTVIRLTERPAAPAQVRLSPPARPADFATASVELPSAATAPRQMRDPIGDMIRGAEPQSEPLRLVLSAQRALLRLGYGPLKADGIMGASTRLAVERFEKDKALPPSGTLSPRVVRALSAAAGVAVE